MSVSFAESQGGLWEGGWRRDGGWWFHAGILKLRLSDVGANKAYKDVREERCEKGER